ncbi:uncharacterized protein LOC134969857 [Pseudophryne corroboree]|uniref:uncharacterized protein LOC134969857 n=1 Tax=Pseudophryne corroboree TaxID=495146 RepID=UPI0030819174
MDPFTYRVRVLYAMGVALTEMERAQNRRRPRSRRTQLQQRETLHERLQRRETLSHERQQRRETLSHERQQRRETLSHMPLLVEIQENNPDDYRNVLSMDDATFQELLSLVTPHLQRQDSGLRRAVPVEQRLATTLRFLVTGRSLQDLKFGSLISPQALGLIIPETCKAIYTALKPRCFKFPSSGEEWKSIAEEFESRWNFPNCGGAMDGKHVRIAPPSDTDSLYYNYKGFHSIVLLAIVNANCEFLFVDVGKNGRDADGGSIRYTQFYERLVSARLHLPPAGECKYGLNFVFVAGEAFVLHEHIMKPYAQRGLTKERRIFNHRLSRTRRIAETAFGLLGNRFRIFHTAINLPVDKVDWVVFACCALHNFLRQKNTQQRPTTTAVPDATEHTEDIDRWTPVAAARVTQAGLVRAKQVREDYLAYFNGAGTVPWQEDSIK